MSVNLASRVRGSGVSHFKGIDLRVKEVMALDFDLKPFDVTDDMYGQLDSRLGGRLVKLTLTPDGVWTAAQLAVIYPSYYLNPTYGDFSTPRRYVTNIDTTLGNITSANHGQLTGTGVRAAVQTGGTLPAGLSATTTYYLWANSDGTTVQLYDTEAHALAANGTTIITGQVIPSSAGSQVVLIHNSPFTVTTNDGVQMVILNAAITDMPDNTLGSTVSSMKQMTVIGYTCSGNAWSDANSIVTYATGVALSAAPPLAAQIPTVPYTVDWATRLVVTAESTTADTVTIANHGILTGSPVTVDNVSGGTLPAPLTAGTTNYAIAVDANTLGFATTQSNAIAGTKIDITTAGTGTVDVVTVANVLGMKSREAIEVNYKLDWEEVPSDENGIDTHQLNKLTVTVSFVPTNVTYQALLNLLALQGGTAARGQTFPGANMDIYGPGNTPFLRFSNMKLQNAPARFGKSADRVDKLTFVSTRYFRGNTPQAIAYLGLAAPTA